MKQLNHFERIYDYAEGQMDTDQRTVFEAELSANEELRAEYDAFLASQKALEYLAFDELGNMAKEGQQPTTKVIPLWRRTWAIAATVLLLIGAGLFWHANQAYSNERLATEFYIDPNFSPNRGTEMEGLIRKASIAFELGHLEDAIEAATAIHVGSVGFQQAQHLLGHAYFKKTEYELAAAHFAGIAKGENAKNAAYMGAYALLLAGQKTEAVDLLNNIANDKNHPYNKNAAALLKKNNSPWRWLVF